MTDAKPISDHHSPGREVKSENTLERAGEGIEALNKQQDYRHKETHGMQGDIDENTSLGNVKAPNVFERAKEEIEAIIGAIHQTADQHTRDPSDEGESKSEKPDNGVKKPNPIERAKEEIDSIFHHNKKKHNHHHKETHGQSDDININTPVDEVKGPNVFERAKEEMEAIMDAIHPKKKGTSVSRSPSASPEKERAGFGCSLGKGLEKVCLPWGDGKKD